MTFKFPKEYEDKLKQENELKYVLFEDGSQKHITEFKDKSIAPTEYQTFRMNSYARNDIYPKLTDETLLEQAEYYISQCHKPYKLSTYNDAIIHLILPELMKRFKELQLSDTSKEESSIKYYNEMQLLEESLKIYKNENELYEISTHIDDFMYELHPNEKGEIPMLIKVHGVEHSLGITEKDAHSFIHIFQMHKD